MADKMELARIQGEPDLRKAWPNEAQDFTPWLAENIDQLSEALGMSLALVQKESRVGDFSLDVLATDQDSDRPVGIENQLEATNHMHLGQLLTYAAGTDAGTMVWITREFREEHRQALDWLNQHTDENTRFFGVVVELWRIGDSPLAPHFRVVASPNDWSKAERRKNPLGPTQQQNVKFRQGLLESLRGVISLRGRNRQARSSFLIVEYPIPGVRYAAIWHHSKPGFELIIDRGGDQGRDWNQSLFAVFEQGSAEIGDQLIVSESEELVWEPVEKQAARIAIYRDGDVYGREDSWDDIQQWMIEKFHKFREIFGPQLDEFAKTTPG